MTPNRSSISDDSFTVTIPRGAYGVFQTGVLLNVSYNGQQFSSTTYEDCKSALVPFISFAAVPPPALSGISGCASDSADGRTTLGCTPTVHSLTLTGSGFLQLNTTTVSVRLGQSQYSLGIFTSSSSYQPTSSNYTDTALVLDLDPINQFLLP